MAASTRQSRISIYHAILASTSLLAALIGLIALVWYSELPGEQGIQSKLWPVDSRIPHPDKRPELLMFLHPHCPCSRASLHELEKLLVHRLNFQTTILILNAGGESSGWERGALWTEARELSNVSVVVDGDGAEARRFGAMTSGHTCLFDIDGRLLFSGGITQSRGHEGDNTGLSAVYEWLSIGYCSVTSTPVFGCPLFELLDAERENKDFHAR